MRVSAVRDTSALENDIAALPGLDLKALRARWLALYGLSAAKSFRRKFLARALAYQMQVDAYGGLSASTKHRLRDIAAAASAGTFDTAMIGRRIKPGTKLVRTWHGETHTVIALEDGFSWNGEQYGSLSVIAKTITGTNWNGWKFFGLKGLNPEYGRDVKGRFKRPPAGVDGTVTWSRSVKAPSPSRELEAAHA